MKLSLSIDWRRALRRLLHPALWFAVLLVGIFLTWNSAGLLLAHRHADSYSYVRAAQLPTAVRALSYHRTVAYPLLIHWLRDGNQRRFDRRFRPLIVLQAAAFLAAVWLLWLGVRRYTGSAWLAFVFALPLPFAGILRTLTNVGPDFLAAAFVLASVGLLLWLTRPRPRWWALLPFSLAVFLSYQLRPAGMFLVGFLPLAGAVLLRSAGVTSVRQLARFGAAVSLATLVPFLAFCSLRWAVVGHFGVVSFTGTNQAGLAISFLDKRLVRELPPELGPMARHALRLRTRRGWNAMGPLDDPRLWFEQYGHNIWEIARSTGEPAVARAAGGAIEKPTLFGFRGVMVERDAQLGALARAILIRRPGLWARWFFAAIGYGLDQLPDDLWLVTPLWLLLLSVPFAAWHVELGGRRAVRPGALSQAERRARLMGLAMVGVSYFAVYLALVCLVSFPFDRYLTSMTLFLPGIGCALVLEAWRSVVAPEVKSHRA